MQIHILLIEAARAACRSPGALQSVSDLPDSLWEGEAEWECLPLSLSVSPPSPSLWEGEREGGLSLTLSGGVGEEEWESLSPSLCLLSLPPSLPLGRGKQAHKTERLYLDLDATTSIEKGH